MIIRAVTTHRASSPESVRMRESILNEVEALRAVYGPYEADRMMNLIMDGQEPTVQLYGGATLTEIEKEDMTRI